MQRYENIWFPYTKCEIVNYNNLDKKQLTIYENSKNNGTFYKLENSLSQLKSMKNLGNHQKG